MQDNIDLVRSSLEKVEIRLSDSLGTVYPVSDIHEFSGGVNELPNPAFSQSGGGRIAIDTTDSEKLKTLERVFWFDLSLPEELKASTFGQHVYVRFTHKDEPIFSQAYRRIRQLFLSKFNV